MAFTEGRQEELIRIPALEFFGACSGQSRLTFGEFMGVECELSFAAPGFQMTRFAGLTLDGIGAVNPKGAISEMYPPLIAEMRAGEIDTTGFGAS
jgi:hypothetical protein